MSRKKNIKEIIENVLIEQVAAEGNALAHIDGKVLFVPQVIPGDIVNVRILRKRSGFMEGFPVEIVTPSPDRIAPFCEHYGDCGGCKWQPLPYHLQLKYKQQQVVDQLQRIGKIEFGETSQGKTTLLPIVGSENTTQYRNKLEYTFSDRRWLQTGEDPSLLFDPPTPLDPADFKGGIFPRNLRGGYSSINGNSAGYGLGFHIVGAFDKVLDIHRCHLQPEPTNEIRLFIKRYAIEHGLSFFNLREQKGLLRTIVVRNNSASEVMLTVVFGENNPNIPLLESIRSQFPQIKSLNYVINQKMNDAIGDLDVVNFSGEDAIYEEMEGLNFKIGPKSFYQTNSNQAYKLYSIVRQFADFKGYERVYDLYTGTGTIALFIARNVASVIGIEYVPEAIEDAKINALNNGIDNCDFYAGDMKDILTSDFISQNGGAPDVVILDPPRAGLHPDVIKVLLEVKPSKIVYVSCNTATQARDILALSALYDVEKVQPVDMFPHTHHIENVALLNLLNN